METAAQTIAVEPAQLQARAAVYRLLGRFWLKEIDADLLHELHAPPLREAFVSAGGLLPQETAETDTLEELEIDYCQLFLGPSGHLPPYQSVWTDGHFQGEATVAAQTHFQELHLPVPRGTADHLGEQLVAMAIVLERLAAAPQVTTSELEAARRFFSLRLTWPNELCKLATQRAQTRFYRSVVAMTQAFLTDERRAWLAAD